VAFLRDCPAEDFTLPPQYVGLKFFNVYGPNEYHKGSQMSVIPQFYSQIQTTEKVCLFKSDHPDYADGDQARDFVYVDDCVDVMLWLLDNPQVSGLYNVGTGQARTFADLARAIFAPLGKEAQITYRDLPEALKGQYQYYTQADLANLRAAGYTRPFTSLEDGVKDYVQNFLMQADRYR
jgi:ADP-L-glycero-D-manno-heptose 6-epimerase